MPLFEQAAAYILGIITEDETVKQFPKEFVSASAQWVRSWFLKDDPKTEQKLLNPNKSLEYKKDIIQDLIDDKKDDMAFTSELQQWLQEFEQQRSRIKNVVSNGSNIEAQGNVHIGDTGQSSGDNYDKKNVVEGSTIKAGGDFRLGDDVIRNNQQVNITHNYYNEAAAPKETPAPGKSSLKAELQGLVAKGRTEQAIEKLMNELEGKDTVAYDAALLLSGRLSRLRQKENLGTIAPHEANVERNQINNSVLSLISEL